MKRFNPSQSQTYPISWNWITLAGPDAQDFLHRLTTVQVKHLAVHRGSPGCFLTAQGKFKAYFKLWRYGKDEFAFELDAGKSDAWKTQLLTTIENYTFSEKMTLTDTSGQLESFWLFPDTEEELRLLSGQETQAGETLATEDEIRICHQGTQDFGRIWISAWSRPGRLSSWLEEKFPDAEVISSSRIEAWRLETGTPKVDAEISESVTPLDVGLKRAISEQKGCYPGQEVIEKIIALGSPAYRLIQIDPKDSNPKRGDSLLNLAQPPVEIGKVTSVSELNGKKLALGLVKKIHAKEGLSVQFSSQPNTMGVIQHVIPYD